MLAASWERARLARQSPRFPRLSSSTSTVEFAKGAGRDEILGTPTFRGDNDQFITSAELSGLPLTQFLFPVVAQDDNYQTGLALLNNNPNQAQVTLQLWDMDGNMITSTSLTLAPIREPWPISTSSFPAWLAFRLERPGQVRSAPGWIRGREQSGVQLPADHAADCVLRADFWWCPSNIS